MKPAVIKKIVSLFIANIMLFDLTASVFAVPLQLVTKEEERNINAGLNNAYYNSSNVSSNHAALEANYDAALKNLSNQADAYAQFEDAVSAALAAEKVENANNEILNAELQKYQKDIDAYNTRAQAYDAKIEKLGGMDNIEKQYDLYQQWLDLKPQMDARKSELEQIIASGDRVAAKQAKKELAEYEQSYYSKQGQFDQFNRDLEELLASEDYFEQAEQKFDKLYKLADSFQAQSIDAKQALIDLLPEQEGLSTDMDWDELFEVAQAEIDKLAPELQKAKEQVERAEEAQDKYYQSELEKKIPQFLEAQMAYCEYQSKEADKYSQPVAYGKVNGKNVPIQPGSYIRRADGTLVADVDLAVVWEERKKAYRACVNPSWSEKNLQDFNAGITMSELGDIKYGEYLLKYGFEEGKKLSEGEAKQMGNLLARKNIGMAIIAPERASEYFFTIYGDYSQSMKLSKYFRQDWKDKGYGSINSVWEADDDGDLSLSNKLTLNPLTAEGEMVEKSYIYRFYNYDNTKNITKNYFYEMNALLTDIIDFIAEQNEKQKNGTRNLASHLSSLGISMTEDFLDVKDSIIDAKLEDLSQNYTSEEKADHIQKVVKKRPFDPLMFALGPSHLIDRNRTLIRERRAYEAGFELNASETIKDILSFNALFQTNYRLYQDNVEAWNNLAYSAYNQQAIQLLANMSELATTMNDKYEKYPQEYSQELEETLHEYGKDMMVDIGLSLFLSGAMTVANAAKSFVTTTAKKLVTSAVKASFKSGFKQGVKALGKRSLSLTKAGLQNSVKNISKALRGSFATADLNSLRTTPKASTQANINAFRQMKFKSPIRGTNRSLGRAMAEENTLFNKTIKGMQSRYNIRPKMSKTSQVFNPDLTKQQLAKLSADIDNFYQVQKATQKAANRNARRVSSVSTEANSFAGGAGVDLTQVAKTQQAFSKDLQGAQIALFGKRGSQAAMSAAPGVPMDFLTGNANLSQIIHRNPLTKKLYNKSVQRTMKAIEKQGLSPDEAKDFFIEDFNGRLKMSPAIPRARRLSIIDDVSRSFGTSSTISEPTSVIGGGSNIPLGSRTTVVSQSRAKKFFDNISDKFKNMFRREASDDTPKASKNTVKSKARVRNENLLLNNGYTEADIELIASQGVDIENTSIRDMMMFMDRNLGNNSKKTNLRLSINAGVRKDSTSKVNRLLERGYTVDVVEKIPAQDLTNLSLPEIEAKLTGSYVVVLEDGSEGVVVSKTGKSAANASKPTNLFVRLENGREMVIPETKTTPKGQAVSAQPAPKPAKPAQVNPKQAASATGEEPTYILRGGKNSPVMIPVAEEGGEGTVSKAAGTSARPAQRPAKPTTVNQRQAISAVDEEPTYVLGGEPQSPAVSRTPVAPQSKPKSFFENVSDRIKGLFRKEEPTYTLNISVPKVEKNILTPVEIIEDSADDVVSKEGKAVNTKPISAQPASKPARVSPTVSAAEQDPTYVLRGGKNSPAMIPIAEEGGEGTVSKAAGTSARPAPKPAKPAQVNPKQAASATGEEPTYVLRGGKNSPAMIPIAEEESEEIASQAGKSARAKPSQNIARPVAQEDLPGPKPVKQAPANPASTHTQEVLPKATPQKVASKVDEPKANVSKAEAQPKSQPRPAKVASEPAQATAKTTKEKTVKDFLLEHHFTENDIARLEQSTLGLQKGERLNRIKSLLEKGFTRDDIMSFSILDRTTFGNIDKLLAKGFSKSDIMVLERNLLVEGYNFERLNTLLRRGFSRDDIMYMLRDNLLVGNNLRTINDLIFRGFSRDNIILLGRKGALQGKKLSRIETLIEKGFKRDDIMLLEKDGFLEDNQFGKIESLLENKVSPNNIMELEKSGRLKDGPSVGTRLRERGFSTEDIMTLQRKHANSERSYEEIEYLLNHGFTRDDIMYLARRDSLGISNLMDMHDLVFRGFSKDDILLLEKNGIFENHRINRVEKLIEKGFKKDDIMRLNKDGFLNDNEFDTLEYYLNKKVPKDTIMHLERNGSLKTAKKYY